MWSEKILEGVGARAPLLEEGVIGELGPRLPVLLERLLRSVEQDDRPFRRTECDRGALPLGLLEPGAFRSGPPLLRRPPRPHCFSLAFHPAPGRPPRYVTTLNRLFPRATTCTPR